MKGVVILGSTGSIGKSSIEVIHHLNSSFRVSGIAAKSNWRELAGQVNRLRPSACALCDKEKLPLLRDAIHVEGVEVLGGEEGILSLIHLDGADIILQAISGADGLSASMESIKAGKRVALANKESLVMAGHILMQLSKETGAEILPIDSEPSAILQSLRGEKKDEIQKIILTASGGPFLNTSLEDLQKVTPEKALKHPRWKMGKKITVDSATLMNKALEIIEAHWLFEIDPSRIEVVIHPQSIVHSLVEFRDASIIAQMGIPDMKVPIQFALTFPERLEGRVPGFAPDAFSPLTFMEPDLTRFPALKLGFEAARKGGTFGATLNAANEEAVKSFLKGRISFTDIFLRVKEVIETHGFIENPSLDEVMQADRWAREKIHEMES